MNVLRAMYNKIERTTHGPGEHHLMRRGLETAATSGILGAVHASVGLDVKGKYPVDAGVAALGLITAGVTGSEDAATIGLSALSAFSFRQGFGFMSEKQVANGKQVKGSFRPLISASAVKMHGDFDMGNDPVLDVARSL